jgi:hypothetical protein
MNTTERDAMKARILCTPLYFPAHASLQFVPRVGGLGEDAAEPLLKCLQILGFTHASRFPQPLFTDTATLVVPVPEKSHPSGLWATGTTGRDAHAAQRSTLLLSSLARALAETANVALVRSKNAANSELRLGVLSPRCSDAEGDCLVLNYVPFADDLRDFAFAPLPGDKPHLVPSPEALSAAAALVDSMMFGEAAAEAARDSGASPENVAFAASADARGLLNPTLRRFFSLMKLRAIDPTAPLGDWDARLLPQAVGTPGAAAAAQQFAAAAATQQGQKKRAVEASDASAKRSRGPEEPCPPAGAEEPCAPCAPSEPRIGMHSPASDFTLALSVARASGDPDAVVGTTAALCETLFAMHDFQVQFHPEQLPVLLQALEAMRGVCLAEGFPSIYNAALETLFAKSRGRPPAANTWTAIQQRCAGGAPLGLISAEEGGEAAAAQGAPSAGEAAAAMARDATAAAPEEAEATLAVAEEEWGGGEDREDDEFGDMD